MHVSPDPDLVTYWLADAIDERGYGIRGDTWEVMDALEAAGRPTWFRLGDRDLAMCLIRTELLAAGAAPDRRPRRGGERHGRERARCCRCADEPVRTRVTRARARAAVPGVHDRRARRGPDRGRRVRRGRATPSPRPRCWTRSEGADAIVIGPSNPVASIGADPGVPGMREALAAAGAPVVAVSPFVGGEVLKGPTLDVLRAGPASSRPRRGCSTPTRACSTAWWPTSPWPACPRW